MKRPQPQKGWLYCTELQQAGTDTGPVKLGLPRLKGGPPARSRQVAQWQGGVVQNPAQHKA